MQYSSRKDQGVMRLRARIFLCLALFLFAYGARAAGGGGAALQDAGIDDYDYSSLQRGAKIFMNYCIGCHGARHARYARIAEDLGVPPEHFERHLLNGSSAKLNDYVLSSIPEQDAKAWFNQAAPPDLTLVSRVRGPNWIYSFLRGYYYDENSLTGWNNFVFENTAMPHVLYDLQGIKVQQAEVAGEELSVMVEGVLDVAGYDAVARDVTNFLAYMGDPGRHFRIRAGIYALLFLMVLIVYTHVLYREYWKDIK